MNKEENAWEKLEDAWKARLDQDPAPDPDPALWDRLRARLEQESNPRFIWWKSPIPWAAMLGLVLGLSLWLEPRFSGSDMAQITPKPARAREMTPSPAKAEERQSNRSLLKQREQAMVSLAKAAPKESPASQMEETHRKEVPTSQPMAATPNPMALPHAKEEAPRTMVQVAEAAKPMEDPVLTAQTLWLRLDIEEQAQPMPSSESQERVALKPSPKMKGLKKVIQTLKKALQGEPLEWRLENPKLDQRVHQVLHGYYRSEEKVKQLIEL